MRTAGFLFLLLALTAGPAWAQGELTPSTEDGPLTITPTPPKPDAEGVYRIGNGVKLPVLVHPVLAIPPSEAAGSDRPQVVLVNAVVGTDGVATRLQVFRSAGVSYDESAIEAIKQSRFTPGTVDGTAVPVLICLNVRFVNAAPPIPIVLPRYPGSPVPRPLGGPRPRKALPNQACGMPPRKIPSGCSQVTSPPFPPSPRPLNSQTKRDASSTRERRFYP